MTTEEKALFQYHHIKALKERIKQLENELERIKHIIIQN
jgi:hypothetical protein